MRIIVLSGLSGSGKSVALHMLEDLGFYCIDNIPAALLKPFISYTVRSPESTYERTAIGLDARNTAAEIATVPQLIDELKRSGIQCEVIFLLASDEELLRRFAETRRVHPMSRNNVDLRAAMALERDLLEPIVHSADLVIDTSRMGVHALREIIHQRVEQRAVGRLSITFESFGFKHGIPGDADFVFDARSLPNPYWEPSLRNLTGRDPEVIRFLEEQTNAAALIEDIAQFMAGAHSRVSGQQPGLSHRRGGMHGRPASLGVHRRPRGRAVRAAVCQRDGAAQCASGGEAVRRREGNAGRLTSGRKADLAGLCHSRPLHACSRSIRLRDHSGGLCGLRRPLAAHEGQQRGSRFHRIPIAELDQLTGVAGFESQIARELISGSIASAYARAAAF